MKQKTMKLTAAVILGGMVLLAAGCMKESEINEKYRPAGMPIAISAATGYENGSGTRTEYSGQLYGDSPKYERIDWVSEDPITIAYVHGSQSVATQYAVTEVNASTDKQSTASIEVMTGQTKLTWGEGSGDHTFYAMYPSNGFGDNTSASLTSNNHVQGSIPAAQTPHVKDGKYLPPMQYGYMVAYKQIASGSSESHVTLPFTPAVTAFEFKLQRAQDDPGVQKVTGVELTATTPLTGTFAFDITGGDADGAIWNKATTGTNPTVLSGTGNTVSMTFPVTGGVSLPEYGSDTYLDFTLFGLPVEQTGLTVKLIFESGDFKTMALNDAGGTPHVFDAAKKHIITNKTVPGGFEYVLRPTGNTVTLPDGTIAGVLIRDEWTAGDTESLFESYVTYDGGVTKTAVPVEAYEYGYENADGTITWASTMPDEFMTSLAFSGSGNEKTITVGLTDNYQIEEWPNYVIEHAQSLKNRPAATDLDLSLYESWNLSTPRADGKRVTANSYIIDRSGTFKFPLVYGNAIDWTRTKVVNGVNPQTTGWNVYSYSDGTNSSLSEHSNYWSDFYRFDGKKITSPYILSDLGLSSEDVEAVVVWEDVESADYSMLTIQETISDESVSGFCNSDGSSLGTVPYIKFTVPVGAITGDELDSPFDRVTGIREGNIVIALRTNKAVTIAGESFPAHTLLWDWHIWISDLDMTPVPVKMRSGYTSITDHHDFLPVPMGFCSDRTERKFKPRVLYVRVQQTVPDSDASILFQILHARSLDGLQETNGVLYQWGRHTPLIPVKVYDEPKHSDFGGIDYTSTITGGHIYPFFKEAYSPSDYPIYDEAPMYRMPSLSGEGKMKLQSFAVNSIQDTYQNPTKWGTNSELFPLSDYSGPFANLWNMGNHVFGNSGIKVSKTVYDPCPPGFSVPDINTFSFMAKNGKMSSIAYSPNLNIADSNGDGSLDGRDLIYLHDNDYPYAWALAFNTGYGNTYYLIRTNLIVNGATTDVFPFVVDHIYHGGYHLALRASSGSGYYGGSFTWSSSDETYPLAFYQLGTFSPSYGVPILPVKELN